MTDTTTAPEATDEEYATIEYLAEHDLSALIIEAPTDTGEWEIALDEDHKRAHLSAWEAALTDPDAPAGVRQLAQAQVDRWEEVCQGEARTDAASMTTSHRGPYYDHAELIRRAIEKYNGETGGAKDYPQELAAVRPEDCRVITTGGKLYVRLFARNVQTVGLVAEYEVVDSPPDLVNMHRADACSADEVQA